MGLTAPGTPREWDRPVWSFVSGHDGFGEGQALGQEPLIRTQAWPQERRPQCRRQDTGGEGPARSGTVAATEQEEDGQGVASGPPAQAPSAQGPGGGRQRGAPRGQAGFGVQFSTRQPRPPGMSPITCRHRERPPRRGHAVTPPARRPLSHLPRRAQPGRPRSRPRPCAWAAGQTDGQGTGQRPGSVGPGGSFGDPGAGAMPRPASRFNAFPSGWALTPCGRSVSGDGILFVC